jgi:hypothetical protein
MKTTRRRNGRSGFVSYVLVLSTGTILTALMFMAYRRSMNSQEVQARVQLRQDYSEKEDAILRSIVSITPNRAMRSMQHNSNASSTNRNPLRWQNIFTESLDLANARTSIPSNILTQLNIPKLKVANSGDSALTVPSRIFKAASGESGFASTGLNRSLGAGYPAPLETSDTTLLANDSIYPMIAATKRYGTLSQSGAGLPVGTYKDFNILTYPQINFGYARPGDPFVAKRNWWAFRMDLADHDDPNTDAVRRRRAFVLSIYEIPSQLAISASSFMSLGQFSTGEVWSNVNIDGNIFAGKAQVDDYTNLPGLASRRGMTIASTSTVGGESFNGNPFTPGVRESHQITKGTFYPVSLASESGRVAFIPINRGADFFDRFSHPAESTVLSPTTWNNYSVGALQCAMRVDITAVTSATNRTPTAMRFSYLKNGVRQSYSEPLVTGIGAALPPGYVKVCDENQSYDFGTEKVDVAYGVSGSFYFQTDVTGVVAFNNARFGDPRFGYLKAGYFRPSAPYKIRQLASGKTCVAVYPQRLAAFLALIGGDSTAVNNSLAVNVDYSTTGINNSAFKPVIPCTDTDYGVILQECADLTSFSKGFSLVTNLRTFIGDDFNTKPATPPTGYTPTDTYYPPVSLFAPEKRYGVELDPFAVSFGGQVGSLASDSVTSPIRPLDSKTLSGTVMGADRVKVNLRPIRHPAELPPVTMMNWLVTIEERLTEYVDY